MHGPARPQSGSNPSPPQTRTPAQFSRRTASRRAPATIQIVPAEVGTHAGLLGGFFVGSFDDTPVIVYAETAVEGITIDKPALVSKAAQAFERLRSEALPRGASRELIRRVAEQRWTT